VTIVVGYTPTPAGRAAPAAGADVAAEGNQPVIVVAAPVARAAPR
jgi:hypothetical protein